MLNDVERVAYSIEETYSIVANANTDHEIVFADRSTS